MTISAPSTITSTQTWQCNIFNLPWVGPIGLTRAISIGPSVTSNAWQEIATPTVFAGGLVAISTIGTGETSLAAIAAINNPAVASLQTLSPPASNLLGKIRIVAAGHEVTNVTSELNVQGTATVWRSPVQDYESASSQTLFGPGFTRASIMSGMVVEAAPTTIAQALILPGSRQWHAKEGSYQAHSFHDVTDVPTEEYNNIQPIYIEQGAGNPGALTVFTSFPVATQTFNTTPITANLITLGVFGAPTWTKFDMCGTFYTGLSPQTVLNVQYNIDIQIFPDIQDTQLVLLAREPLCYDEVALRAYAKAISRLPVGVMQKDNGLGEWFRETVQELAPYVKYGASAIAQFSGDARVKALAGAVGGAAHLAGQFLGPPGSGKLRGTLVPVRERSSNQRQSESAYSNKGGKNRFTIGKVSQAVKAVKGAAKVAQKVKQWVKKEKKVLKGQKGFGNPFG